VKSGGEGGGKKGNAHLIKLRGKVEERDGTSYFIGYLTASTAGGLDQNRWERVLNQAGFTVPPGNGLPHFDDPSSNVHGRPVCRRSARVLLVV